MSELMRGYISGIADNSRINYCPLCRAVLGTNAYYGDGTVVCNECDFHFAVIECEEKGQKYGHRPKNRTVITSAS